MRLTNADKIRVAAKVTHEKIEKRRVELIREITREATAMYKAVYGKWTEHVKDWPKPFTNSFQTKRVQAPGQGFRLDVDTPVVTTYSEGASKGKKENMYHHPLPNYHSTIVVKLGQSFASTHETYQAERRLDTRRLNPLFEKLVALSKEADAIFTEVHTFVSQFGTYRKLQKEWPDIDRYLKDRDQPQKKKGEVTALIKTGADLNKFLAKH